MKIDTRKAAFEFFSIIVAVVLAMALSEWRQEYNNKKLAEKSYERILNEIAENREKLLVDAENISHDIQYLNEWIRLVVEEKNYTDFDLNYTFAMLNNSAMEVAKINQSLAYIPEDKLMALAAVHKTIDFYSDKGSKIFNFMSDLTGAMDDIESKDFINNVRVFKFQLTIVRNTMYSFINEANVILEQSAKPE